MHVRNKAAWAAYESVRILYPNTARPEIEKFGDILPDDDEEVDTASEPDADTVDDGENGLAGNKGDVGDEPEEEEEDLDQLEGSELEDKSEHEESVVKSGK